MSNYCKPNKFWQNSDRLCVILIFIQLNECTISFMLLLMFLFFTGAVLQKIAKSKYNTALRGQAEVLQFFVHLLARYLAFFACCWQSQNFQHNSWIFFFVICLCSILYVIHILFFLFNSKYANSYFYQHFSKKKSVKSVKSQLP